MSGMLHVHHSGFWNMSLLEGEGRSLAELAWLARACFAVVSSKPPPVCPVCPVCHANWGSQDPEGAKAGAKDPH